MCLGDGDWGAGKLPSVVVVAAVAGRALGTARSNSNRTEGAGPLHHRQGRPVWRGRCRPAVLPRRPPRRRRGALRSCLVTPMAPPCSSARQLPKSRPRSSTSSQDQQPSGMGVTGGRTSSPLHDDDVYAVKDEAAYLQADDEKPPIPSEPFPLDRLPVLRQALGAGRRTLRGKAPSPGSQHLSPRGRVDIQRVRCPEAQDPRRGAPRTSHGYKGGGSGHLVASCDRKVGLAVPGRPTRSLVAEEPGRRTASATAWDRGSSQDREPRFCDDPDAGLSPRPRWGSRNTEDQPLSQWVKESLWTSSV